ncbi:hypothetical protein BBP40_010721 [Aspergillus hancockii]|nr:hypothetical protein BBP40_010721 [Aspergillus hancockii]
MRLGTTVLHGRAADAIYSLAPLVICSSAEMTCGFFIVCLPCIPKPLKETRVIRSIKRAFGMKTTSSVSHKMSTNSMKKGRLEEGTESMEHLHNGMHGAGIVRTTRITITEESRTIRDDGASDKTFCPYIATAHREE